MATAASSVNQKPTLKLIEGSLKVFVAELRARSSAASVCHGDVPGNESLDADPSFYSYLEAVLTDDCDGDDDDASVLELLRAHVPLLEAAPDSDLRDWLDDCRRQLAEAAVEAETVATEPAEAATVVPDRRRSVEAAASAIAAEAESREALGRMLALFPEACAIGLRCLLADSGGDLQAAVNQCLEVGGPAECPRGPPCTCLKAETAAAAASGHRPESHGSGVKSYIMSRFEDYELPDEGKVHRPEARFDERPRLTRYLDSRVVAQNGARFVEIKDEREEEIRKATTVCIRPARKYRFH